MTGLTRSKKELQLATNHLHYEIVMFQALAQTMALGITGRGNVINSSLLEAFAIHVRALIGFFYSDGHRKDDIIAEHFLLMQVTGRKSAHKKQSCLIKPRSGLIKKLHT
jgi:hypothetical protein